MYKKRSQSSLRAKTLHSEADPNQSHQWMGNFQTTKSRTKYSQNIASSMIEQANKQNNQINAQACRSVQQLSDRSEVVNRTPTTYKNTIMNKDQYGLQVTPHSNFIKIQSSEKQKIEDVQQYNGGSFNYVEQYYEVQIESLNNKISEMSGELKKYRELYSSKQCELEDLSEGLSTRISKQNNEKNVLIKQINSNNIEIKRLREEINLHKSEKQTLKIVLKQKQTVIEELNNSIVQVEYKKKKVEGYEMQLRQSHSTLQEIQVQMNKLKSEAEKKDLIISNSNKKIAILENKLLQYQEDIKELERCTIALKENTSSSHHKVEIAERQCEEWKNKYCEVKLQLEQIPELQAKLRNVQSTMDQMQAKMKQMFVANQKLKIDLVNYQSLKNKNFQLEKELLSLRNLIRQKCEELETIQNSNKMSQKIQEQLEFFRSRLTATEREIQEKDQEIRLSKMRIQEKEHKIKSLNEQLEQISKQSIRIKELQNKVDTLFIENEKLHSNLLEKISEIQDLQRKINILQSKQITMSNQFTKLKAMYDGISEELSESQSNLENMKNRWESELGAKMGLEEKCTRLSKEIVGLKTQIMSLEQNNKNLTEKSEQLATEFEQKKLELYMQLDELSNYKLQAETQLQISQRRTEQLRSNISGLKTQISEHIQKQTAQVLKIREFQTKMLILQDELSHYKDQSEKIRKHWVQVQEISNLALMQYK